MATFENYTEKIYNSSMGSIAKAVRDLKYHEYLSLVNTETITDNLVFNAGTGLDGNGAVISGDITIYYDTILENVSIEGSVTINAASQEQEDVEEEIYDYQKFLYNLTQHAKADKSYPLALKLNPPEEFVYTVDLNTRTINTPEVIGKVQYDDNSDIIYFKMDRYYGNMDLATCVCVIEFKNAKHIEEEVNDVQNYGVYFVPYYDIGDFELVKQESGNDILTPIMYVPWSIGGLATAYPGEITFTLRFFQLSADGESYYFNMSMIPKTGTVLESLGIDYESVKELQVLKNLPNGLDVIRSEIKAAAEAAAIYWIDA